MSILQSYQERIDFIMNESVMIGNTELVVKEYKNIRVITFKDIDRVHKRPEGTARKRFNDNKKHFIEGEDYFKVTCDEVRPFFGQTLPNGFNPNANVALITESGYLMLVKSFTDDLAWKIQRELVNSYFKVKEIEKNKIVLPNFNNPVEAARAWADELEAKLIAQKEVERLDKENKTLKPKAKYFDVLVDKKLNTSFRDTAKEIGIKETDFIVWLLKNKYIYRNAPSGKLKPYAQFAESGEGLFTVKDVTALNGWTGQHTYVTPKGKQVFQMLLTAENLIASKSEETDS